MNSVSIGHVIRLAQDRHVAVPAELGGCIVLAAADQLVSKPVRVAADQVFLLEDGSLRVSSGEVADAGAVESELRHILEALLETATGVPPALRRAAHREPRGELDVLVRELEVALVPTNRGAAKRALARLCREATRALAEHPVVLDEISKAARDAEHVADPPMPSVPIAVDVSSISIAEIPDLEVPEKKDLSGQPCPVPEAAEDRTPEVLDVPGSAVPVVDAGSCEPVELSDADLESVQCPNVGVDEAAGAQDALSCVVDDTIAREITAPFPLTRVAKAHAPPSTSACGGAKARSRLRMRPVFRAIQVDPDLTMPMLAAPPECLADSPEGAAGVERAQQLGPDGGSPTTRQIPVTRQGAERVSGAARLEEPKPVTGPHRFVAPARFAKITSKVSERVSQFARESPVIPNEPGTGSQKIASRETAGEAPASGCGHPEEHAGAVGLSPNRSHRQAG